LTPGSDDADGPEAVENSTRGKPPNGFLLYLSGHGVRRKTEALGAAALLIIFFVAMVVIVRSPAMIVANANRLA
jgi:hypothetical protein